jgi:predicted phosphoribosyltransferase
MDRARRAVKTERLLFRGQRPLRSVEGATVVIVEGQLTSPWKVLAAARSVQQGGAVQVVVAAAVATNQVKERVRAHRFDLVCPTVLLDAGGHPRPFGDPQDPSAERLRSIVVARQAA